MEDRNLGQRKGYLASSHHPLATMPHSCSIRAQSCLFRARVARVGGLPGVQKPKMTLTKIRCQWCQSAAGLTLMLEMPEIKVKIGTENEWDAMGCRNNGLTC